MIDAATAILLRQTYPALDALPLKELDRVFDAVVLWQLPPGARFFDEQSACSAFPLLLAGHLRVAKVGSSGREIVLYRLAPGECCIISTASLLGQTGYGATSDADGEVTLATLPRADFEGLMALAGPFRDEVFREFGTRFADLMLRVDSVAVQGLDQQLASWLMEHAPVARASTEDIASELGSANERVRRLLAEFAARGWVLLGREKVRITDPLSLEQIADGARH